jgi:hypothetical protein
MPRKIPQEVQDKLSDRNWLVDMHVHQLFSIVELSKMLKVTPASVTKAIRKNSIQTPSQQALREASNIRKYGVPNPGCIKEFRDKAVYTMTEKYGGHVWSHKGTRYKRNKTCLKKYGNENVGRTEYSINKARETNFSKFGRAHPNQNHIPLDVLDNIENKEWLYEQHVIQKKTLSQIASECGFVDMTIIMNRLRKYGIDTRSFQISFEEKQLVEYIKTLGIETIITNTRKIISPKELDIYLPEYNLAIEYCGVFWHGEFNGKHRSYHKNKLESCNKKDIRLLTIYDEEWNFKTERVKQKIASIIKKQTLHTVYARKCTIKQISVVEKQLFFNKNHIQGDGPSSINYGLFHNNVLLAAIGFIKKSNNTFVLNRFATSCNVPGGFSKLLFYFCKNNTWSKIITFADLRWSQGNVYEKNGFVLDKVLPPDYSYIINSRPCHKFAFRRKYLKRKLQNFDPILSEWENCKANNIDRIWDCGKKRYALTNKQYKV